MKKILLFVFLLVGCVPQQTYDEKVNEHFKSNSFSVNERYFDNRVISFYSEDEVGAVWFEENGDLFKTVRSPIEYQRAVDVKVMDDEKSTVIALFIMEEDIFNESDYAIISFLNPDVEPITITLTDQYQVVWIEVLNYCLSSCEIDKIQLFSGSVVTYTEAFIPT